MELSCPATAMACWTEAEDEDAGRRAVDSAVATGMDLGSRFRRMIIPSEARLGTSRRRSSAPLRSALFWSRRMRLGVRKRRARNFGRVLVEAKASGWGVPCKNSGSGDDCCDATALSNRVM